MIKSLDDTWEKVFSHLSSAKQGKKMSPSVNFHRNKGTRTGLRSLPVFDSASWKSELTHTRTPLFPQGVELS